ncbi:MAG TPA: hypothetical protein VD768_03585 [Sphingomicrobium sp.]|nr:hypothetical protein [Sphingomicrobium sp.]
MARLGAALGRWPKDKFLPSMDDLLKPAEPRRPQSPEEMLAAFQEMKASGAPMAIRKVG